MPPIQYIVEGGQRLSGTIEPSGNKNSALPIIAAALLTEHPVTLDNVPRIRDTETLVELIRSVGATAEWKARNTLAIHAKEIRAADLDPELCARIRASILLAGPLLARCGEVALPPPGGDVIGRRRLDTHFLAFEQLGATVTATHRLEFRASRLKGADVFLDEPSVTATENALVAAVAASGTTYLRNAASEPHVQDLAHFLVELGARIDGIGTNTMVIEAGRRSAGATHHPPRPYRGRLADRACRSDALAAAHRARRCRAPAFDPRLVQPPLHGPHGHVQQRRDLGQWPAVEVVEHHHRPVVGLESLERPLEQVEHLDQLQRRGVDAPRLEGTASGPVPAISTSRCRGWWRTCIRHSLTRIRWNQASNRSRSRRFGSSRHAASSAFWVAAAAAA